MAQTQTTNDFAITMAQEVRNISSKMEDWGYDFGCFACSKHGLCMLENKDPEWGTESDCTIFNAAKALTNYQWARHGFMYRLATLATNALFEMGQTPQEFVANLRKVGFNVDWMYGWMGAMSLTDQSKIALLVYEDTVEVILGTAVRLQKQQ